MKKQNMIVRSLRHAGHIINRGNKFWKWTWLFGFGVFLPVVFPTGVFGAAIYVSPSGSHTFPYDSWAAAATNIGTAVAVVRDNDIIHVGDGVYSLAEQIVVTNAITIQSENGALNTIVDGNDSCRCFYLSHSDALIDGFMLQGGKADEGGGVYLREGGTVQNCIIISNSAPSGGGAFMYYGGLIQSSVIADNRATTTNVRPAGNFFYGGGVHCYNGGTVQDCTIRDNAVTSEGCPSNTSYYCYGGGVYAWHAGIIQNCLIADNQALAKNAAAGGGVYLHEESLLRNCIVSSNTATASGSAFPIGEGGGVYVDLAGTIEACTIVQNTAIGTYAGAGGGVFTFRISSAIRNTIIAFNHAVTGADYSNDETNAQYSYCCSIPLLPGTGNMAANPLLADILAGDYHLQSGSPCIDAGNNDEAPAFDYEFNDRPLDGNGDGSAVVDIGAYEYTTNRLFAPAAVSASDGTFASMVRVTWDALSGASAYDIWRNTNVNFLTATRIGENVAATCFHDTDAITGCAYHYWVKAKTSPFSSSDTGWRAPAVNDYDGDGKSDLAVYSAGYWSIYSLANGLILNNGGAWGDADSIPVPGDYDGDGKADLAVYNNGYWSIYSLANGLILINGGAWGDADSIPVSGDYD
ncbi:MAG: VCBS repeat-containing protein, partial [Verrucomicrobia bacterium]|nr:VCBS repeat-containing protein [Verrucomicrobiota bacterium]